MKILISILNYNGKEDTIACLKSLDNLRIGENLVQVLVIDNASREEVHEADLTLKHIPVALIKNKDNLGFAGGHNVGLRYAIEKNMDYVMILNNDTVVHENLLIELLKTAKENEKAGVIAPKIYFASGSEYHKERYKKEDLGKVIWFAGGIIDWKNMIGHHRGVDDVDKGQFDKVEEIEYGSGCCLLLKREVLEKVGFFDDRYFLYYEDGDLQERIKKHGYTIIFSPKAKLWHKNAASSGGSGSPLQDYYITRNRLLFGFLYAPNRTKLALMRESLRILAKGRVWQRRGVIDFYAKRFGKGTYKP